MITDLNYYLLDFGASFFIALIVGPLIENIKAILAIVALLGVFLSVYYQNLSNPSLFSNLNVMNNQIEFIVVFAIGILVPMVIGKAGTELGEKMREAFGY